MIKDGVDRDTGKKKTGEGAGMEIYSGRQWTVGGGTTPLEEKKIEGRWTVDSQGGINTGCLSPFL